MPPDNFDYCANVWQSMAYLNTALYVTEIATLLFLYGHLRNYFAITTDWMMVGGHFLIDMQWTGPKLGIFHGFFGFVILAKMSKKIGLLDWKKKSWIFYRNSHKRSKTFHHQTNVITVVISWIYICVTNNHYHNRFYSPI